MATNSDPVYPEFFKVHYGNVTSESMQIPPAFVIYLPQPHPRRVVLLNSDGNTWTVKLTRTPTGVYFENGWKKFVKDSDLKYGELVVFKYDGWSTFGVSIYGLSDSKERRAQTEIVEITDDEEGDEADFDSGSNDVRAESSSFFSLGREEETEDEVDMEPESEDELETSAKKRSRGRYGCSSEAQGRFVESRIGLNFHPVARYLQDPSNPFMFVKLKKRRFELRLSAQIVKDYDLKFRKFVHFIDPFGRLRAKTATWRDLPVCIKGWNSICRRNKLKSTDTIICEFIRNGRWVEFIKVNIIRDGFGTA